MNKFNRTILTIFNLSFFCLVGCQSVKSTLGFDHQTPNEFAVSPSNYPLEMPPDFYDLPTPEPGISRPQELGAPYQAQKKLFGVPSLQNSNMSQGEKALIEMVDADLYQEDIRQQIDNESKIRHIENKTLLEQLGLKKEKSKGKVINPYEEARELQRRGIPQTTYETH